MDISDYNTEDFVLDPSFKRWVLKPDANTNIKWEKLLQQYPYQRKNASEAREILINLSIEQFELESDKKKRLWIQIKKGISQDISNEGARVVPLNAKSILARQNQKKRWSPWLGLKVSGLALLVIGMTYLVYQKTPNKKEPLEVEVVFEERITPPGVKKHLKLMDGTRVILNANSRLKFPRTFGQHNREVFLEGEAFFDVVRDSLRPFSVQTGDMKTTVLGTTFNIREYPDGKLDIALVSGEVTLESPILLEEKLKLKPGEMIRKTDKEMKISLFDEETVIAWTKKTILFKNTPLNEAIRVMENWYGVKIKVRNVPSEIVTFSGKYKDESLENVLKGLSYVSGFQYEIQKESVTIEFKNMK